MPDVAEVLVVLGSARSDGDTAVAVARLTQALEPARVETIDLASLVVAPFRYERPGNDDFDFVIARMLAHRSIVIATPVYWYAMSGLTKTLFDRLSDTLSGRDPARRGRSLAGRSLWVLSVGSDPRMPPGFEVPFTQTAAYLGLAWRGACYVNRDATPDECDCLIAELASSIVGPPSR